MRRFQSTLGVIGLVGVLSACTRPRTEIVAVVDSELPWGVGATIQSVSVEVRQNNVRGRLHSLEVTGLGVGAERRALPLAVGLLPPKEESDAAVWIEVRGCATPDGCALGEAVVVQRAVVRFVEEQTMELPMLLSAACGGAACTADQRCVPTTGRCVAATSAQETVRTYDGPGTSVGADATVRADMMDAGASDDRPDAGERMDAGDANVAMGDRPDVGDVDVATGEQPDMVDSGTMGDVLSPPPDNGPCPSGQTLCGGVCRDLQTNADHCGACDRACSSSFVMGRACVAGVCTGTCATGRGNCDSDLRTNGCEVDLANTATHCGACGTNCILPNAISACQANVCRVAACIAGYGECDGSASNGCETNVGMGNVSNCGGCGIRCPTPAGVTALCTGGTCRVSSVTCGAGTGNCDGNDANGCELVTLTDVRNCGPGGMTGATAGAGCGIRCSSVGGTPGCTGGLCTIACTAGFGDCDGNVANGCETNTATEVTHCGRCGARCVLPANATPGCVGSACTFTCSAGYGDCDANAANGCETNTQTSLSNCGACGRVCLAAQTCTAGSCVARCPLGMQFIPAGMFLMGSTTPLQENERPVHGVQLSAFCMDTTEVTVAAWRGCSSPGCTTPTTGGSCNWGVTGRDNHPINCVDWTQAQAYCRSRGEDLPTEAQWEFAARGTDGRVYPWGNSLPGSQLCWRGGGTARVNTCAVGLFATGNSPFGLFDMAGNVWEWTSDWYAPYTGTTDVYVVNPTGPSSGGFRSLRGGSWVRATASEVSATFRYGSTPADRNGDVGFRCARAAD